MTNQEKLETLKLQAQLLLSRQETFIAAHKLCSMELQQIQAQLTAVQADIDAENKAKAQESSVALAIDNTKEATTEQPAA